MGNLKAGAAMVALLAALTPCVADAQTAPPSASNPAAPSVALDLPAQDLGRTLLAIGQATGANVLFTTDSVAGKRAGLVRGRFTLRAALDEALRGTGLRAEIGSDGVASVVATDRRSQARPATLSLARESAPPEEIVVTANKRAELLRNAPISVTAISRADLDKLNAVRFSDYLTRIPSMSVVSAQQGATQLTLRGVTSGPVQPNATVATYVDETPMTVSNVFARGSILTPDIDTFDMQRIEVLRGPQGTLYGASTLGGLLKYVTTAPDLNVFSARAQLEGTSVAHGGFGESAKAMVNIPVTDQVAVRASAYHRIDPGFVDDDGRGRSGLNKSRVDGGRLAILVKPTDWLETRLTVSAQNLRNTGSPVIDITLPNLQPVYGDLQQRRLFDDASFAQYRVYNMTSRADFGWAELVSSTSFNTLRSGDGGDLTPSLGALLAQFGIKAAVGNVSAYNHRKATQEFRLQSSGTNVVDWQLGLFGTHERTNSTTAITLLNPATFAPLPGISNFASQRLAARFTEAAVFGSATWHVDSKLDLTVGVRQSHNKQHFTDNLNGLLAGNAFIQTTSSDSSFTYLFNPRWKPTEDIMVYGRVAKGYRPGGPNAFIPTGSKAPLTFEPDSLVSYEAGVKTQLLDKRLSVDVSAFYIDWTNVQMTVQENNFSFMGNGGAATTKGAEWTVSYQPINGLTLATGGSYLYAALSNDAPGVGGKKGDVQPGVARWGFTADADYEWQAFDGWKASLGASWRYVGSRVSNYTVNVGRVRLPAYDVVDLRAGFQSDRWTFALHGKNIADERGITDVGARNAFLGSAAYIQPRTVLLTVGADF